MNYKEFFRKNKKIITIVGIGLLAILLIVSVVFAVKYFSKDKKDENATSASVTPNTTITPEKTQEEPKKEEKVDESKTIERQLIIEDVNLGINANPFTVNDYAEEHQIFNDSQMDEVIANNRFFDKKDLKTDDSNQDLIAVYFNGGTREEKKSDNQKYTLEELKNLGNGASKMYIFWKRRIIISD
ncbi:hypothetical protein [Candidatus Phytoplasma pruni]|uniref:Uncharacterized protein n=1 Tax=Candidatus Phytoplasma pruni TaxID=479893 RepID=A0A851HC45_9MOLU|nr:hypothetical protein [Candidatus Phytoplasma pruni]NWN45645.1 hypothetical protein [Candidatus Phytoplasma pruni]